MAKRKLSNVISIDEPRRKTRVFVIATTRVVKAKTMKAAVAQMTDADDAVFEIVDGVYAGEIISSELFQLLDERSWIHEERIKELTTGR